jgi:radical SAM superfamily enzyme YgiQ (UPF0313 family)
VDPVLVIKPPYPYFPVGMAYVLAALERDAIPFVFVDTGFDREAPLRTIEAALTGTKYSAVTTGGLVGELPFFDACCRLVKRLAPEIPLILGGPVTRDMRLELLFEHLHLDAALLGEAEVALPALLRSLGAGLPPDPALPGVACRREGKVVRTAPVRHDLAKSNIMPAWHHIDVDYYLGFEHGTFAGRRVMPVLTGRGCTSRCSFCSPTIGAFKPRPVPHIIEEINVLNARYRIDMFQFVNEVFFSRTEDILAFCAAYRAIPDPKPWFCLVRADLEPAAFVAMKAAGCVGFNVGVESGSDRILEKMRKGTTVHMVQDFFRFARPGRELAVEASFMLGNEYETPEEMQATTDLMLEEGISGPCSLTIPYPGTAIYARAVADGRIQDEWEYALTCPYHLNYRTLQDPSTLGNLKHPYLNVSGIPQEEFWARVYHELRRYNSALFRRFKGRKPRMVRRTSAGMEVRLDCSVCGESTQTWIRAGLTQVEICRCLRCFHPVFVDCFALPGQAAAGSALVEALSAAKRVAVLGTRANAADLVNYDRFNLPLDRVAGFLELDPARLGDPFFHLPRFPLEALGSMAPDVLLATDMPAAMAASILAERGVVTGAVILSTFPQGTDEGWDREALAARINGWARQWAEGRKRVLVYGAGLLASDLFQWTALAQANPVAVVDRRADLQGRKLWNVPVIAPERIREYAPEVILIASIRAREEIRASLAPLAAEGVELVTL